MRVFVAFSGHFELQQATQNSLWSIVSIEHSARRWKVWHSLTSLYYYSKANRMSEQVMVHVHLKYGAGYILGGHAGTISPCEHFLGNLWTVIMKTNAQIYSAGLSLKIHQYSSTISEQQLQSNPNQNPPSVWYSSPVLLAQLTCIEIPNFSAMFGGPR